MAQTSNTYTVGSSGQAGPYSYAFPLINTTDLIVSVNGVIKTVSTDFTVDATNSRITFVSGKEPSNSDTLILYRKTDEDPINTVFVSGSTVRAQELNDNFRQLLYISQETADQALSSLGSTLTNAKLNGSLDADNNKVINVADGTAAKDAVNKGQLDATQTYNDSALTTAVANATTQATTATTKATEAAASATTAATNATNASNYVTDAQKYANNAEDSSFTTSGGTANQYSALHYAQKAEDHKTAAAVYASKTYFYGFKGRNTNSNLRLIYSGAADNATYPISDHTYKNGTQWWIGFSDVLDPGGIPKYYYSPEGKVILETYNSSTPTDDVSDLETGKTMLTVSSIGSSPSSTYRINRPGDKDYFGLDWTGMAAGTYKLKIRAVGPTPVRDLGVQLKGQDTSLSGYSVSNYYRLRINNTGTAASKGIPVGNTSVTGNDGNGKDLLQRNITKSNQFTWHTLIIYGIGHDGNIIGNPAYLGDYNIQITT